MKINVWQISLCMFILSSCHVYDVVIQDGTIYDGDGGPPYAGDIAIKDQKIVRIDSAIRQKTRRKISAKNLVVAPGFIDLHAHLGPLALYPDAASAIMQGITTALGGPDGGSPFPLGEYLMDLEKKEPAINVAYLVGHNTIRNHVMGPIDSAPSVEEMETMKQLVREAMMSGAFGLSTGLKYLPGTFADLVEIVKLAEVAAQYGGIYTSHLRDEGTGLIAAVKEAIEIGRQAEVPIILTHHKVMGARNWGASSETLDLVDQAQKQGQLVLMDQYPYTASHTSLRVVIPSWSLSRKGEMDFLSRCADPYLRDSIRTGIIQNLFNDRGGEDLKRIQFAKIDWKPAFVGKTLHDLLVSEGIQPTLENAADMIIEIQLHQGAMCIYHVMHQGDVDRIMQHKQTMIASDGAISQMNKGHPHPRSYGTFPRVLGHYVRERAILDLPEAIRKMTSAPAEALRLQDRGRLLVGQQADITIFDPKTIKDQATFQSPHAYPEGIEYVLVNGHIALDNGHLSPDRNGQILRNIKAIHMN